EDALAAGGGGTAGLFDDHRHRVGLVHQAQLAALTAALFIHRIHEDAAPREHAVYVGHHRGHPAHVEVAPTRPFLALLQLGDVALHRLLPEARVGGVDGKFGGIDRHGHVRMGVDEAA